MNEMTTYSVRTHTSPRYVIVALLFGFLLPTIAFAQQEAGIGITPAIIEESLDPGAVEEYSVTLENINTEPRLFYIFTRDIAEVKSGGTPVFAEFGQATGYELADWVEVGIDQIEVPAGGEVTVPFTLRVPANASPGSHFGGLFFSVEPPELEKSGAAIGYQVANILSIRIAGDVVEQGTIRQFSTSKFLYGTPNVSFDVRIENSGNVLIRPYGPLEIYNMLGKKVADLTFNDERHGVFPGDTRAFSNIIWEGDVTGFGRYEAILSPVYGEQGSIKTMSSTVTFWVLPMHIIGPALIVLAVILLFTFVAVRLYVKRSLLYMQGGRRVIRRRRRRGSSTFLLFSIVLLTVCALFLIALLVLFA